MRKMKKTEVAKKRKVVEDVVEDEEVVEDEDEIEDEDVVEDEDIGDEEVAEDEGMDEEVAEGEGIDEETQETEKKTSRSEAAKKTGVIYFPFIPQGFTPNRMIKYFEKFAPNAIGRIFLAKKKYTKSKDDLYKEGWLEIKKKRYAKRIADQINGQEVGGKKIDPVSTVIWNIRYLSGFKWYHLVEQLNYEKNVEDKRLQTEVSQIRKFSAAYEENVEKGHNLKKLEEKVLKQGGKWEQFNRQFNQKKVKKYAKDTSNVDSKEVMKMIFG